MSEYGLGHEDALGMMSKGAMAEVGNDGFRCIEPVMDVLVICDCAAPLLNAGETVMKRMWHGGPLKRVGIVSRFGVELLEVQLDALLGNVERELALTPIVVLPASVLI